MSKSAWVARGLGWPAVGRLARAAPLWNGLLVLVYHRIAGASGGGPDGGVTSATQDELDDQLGWLARHADVVDPDALPDVLDRRGRHVLVTFDDGYRDNYELAYPVLRHHGLRGVFFVVSGFLDRPRLPWWDEFAWIARSSPEALLPEGEWLAAALPLRPAAAAVRTLTDRYKSLPSDRAEAFLDWCGERAGCGRADPALAAELWMDWDMAREMRTGGMAIGGHTDTHPVLSRLDRAGQSKEVARCRERLEAELGEPMSLFSYPVGLRDSFDGDTRACLREQGVQVGFSCYGGYQRRGGDRYDVRRSNVSRATDRKRLNAMLISPGLFARW